MCIIISVFFIFPAGFNEQLYSLLVLPYRSWLLISRCVLNCRWELHFNVGKQIQQLRYLRYLFNMLF